MQIKILENNKTPNGWSFVVWVMSDGETTHKVLLKKDIWEELRGYRENQEDLIVDSFKFLLERESNQSILKKFDLELIREYFPEYQEKIRK